MVNAKKIWEKLKFLYIKYVAGYAIPDAPHFDQLSQIYFMNRISCSRIYLEYGTGGSTIHASRWVDKLFAVDSDSYFMKAVQKKLDQQPRKATCRLIYADIGRTGPWGRPIKRKYEPGREPASWRAYPELPWTALAEENIRPDTILIDGRFRVACALASLRHLPAHSETEILFDDYAERQHYHALEQYALLKAVHGRMAIFMKNPAIADTALDVALRLYSHDSR